MDCDSSSTCSSCSSEFEDYNAIVKEELKKQTSEQTQIADQLSSYIAADNLQKFKNEATAQNCNYRCSDGNTILSDVAKSESATAPEGVKHLLQLGADVNQTDHYGSTAIFHAIWFCNVEVLQVLLQAGVDVNSRITGCGTTPLIAAASLSSELIPIELITEIVRILLQNGADPFARSCKGKNALHKAAKRELKQAQKLISAAMKRPDWEAIAKAERQKLGCNQQKVAEDLHEFAAEGELDKLKQLATKQNCNFRIAEYLSYRTLLMTAAEGYNENVFKTVQYLLQLGADFEKRDSCGRTALHHAAEQGNASVVKLILQKAPHLLEERNIRGDTALTLSTIGEVDPPGVNAAATVVALLEAGADPLAVADNGNSAVNNVSRTDLCHAELLLLLAQFRQQQQNMEKKQKKKLLQRIEYKMEEHKKQYKKASRRQMESLQRAKDSFQQFEFSLLLDHNKSRKLQQGIQQMLQSNSQEEFQQMKEIRERILREYEEVKKLQ